MTDPQCNGTAKCRCGRIYPCPLPPGHETKHPTELDECHQCRSPDARGVGSPSLMSTT